MRRSRRRSPIAQEEEANPAEWHDTAFDRALEQALDTPEMQAALGQAPADEVEFIHDLARRSSEEIWQSLAWERQRLDALHEERRQVRARLRHPVVWVLQHLVTLPQLQGVLVTVGVALIGLAFAVPYLGTSYGLELSTGTPIFIGLGLLALSAIDGVLRLTGLEFMRPNGHVLLQFGCTIVGVLTITLPILLVTGMVRMAPWFRFVMLFGVFLAGGAFVLVVVDRSRTLRAQRGGGADQALGAVK